LTPTETKYPATAPSDYSDLRSPDQRSSSCKGLLVFLWTTLAASLRCAKLLAGCHKLHWINIFHSTKLSWNNFRLARRLRGVLQADVRRAAGLRRPAGDVNLEPHRCPQRSPECHGKPKGRVGIDLCSEDSTGVCRWGDRGGNTWVLMFLTIKKMSSQEPRQHASWRDTNTDSTLKYACGNIQYGVHTYTRCPARAQDDVSTSVTEAPARCGVD